MPVSDYFKAGLFVVAAAAALFAAAGTIAVPAFWAYLAIFAVVMIASFAALDPDLLRERIRPGGKKLPLSLRVFSLVLFMHWIVAGLDRGRFHWSDNVPDWLQGVCLFTVAAGYALALWAMRVNRFFSSVIRIQTDRGQHVVHHGAARDFPRAASARERVDSRSLDPVGAHIFGRSHRRKALVRRGVGRGCAVSLLPDRRPHQAQHQILQVGGAEVASPAVAAPDTRVGMELLESHDFLLLNAPVSPERRPPSRCLAPRGH
jgi:hypothetical protein